MIYITDYQCTGGCRDKLYIYTEISDMCNSPGLRDRTLLVYSNNIPRGTQAPLGPMTTMSSLCFPVLGSCFLLPFMLLNDNRQHYLFQSYRDYFYIYFSGYSHCFHRYLGLSLTLIQLLAITGFGLSTYPSITQKSTQHVFPL